jgi:3-hydroxybutyryl-CoA dehydrogenase
MHILVIDGGHVEAEFREKFGPAHEYTFYELPLQEAPEDWDAINQQAIEVANAADAMFFCGPSVHGYLINNRRPQVPLFWEASTASIFERGNLNPPSFGFCGLPTLLNRRLLEVSLYDEADRAKLAETCVALGTDYRVVADRVGLVTPRVICQIINEACFTVQEGTATMQDVDLGMQLGTSYPHGPFAWANAIGVERVYAVLEAMWQDTHDERYKVCPLLKRQALRGEPFAI